MIYMSYIVYTCHTIHTTICTTYTIYYVILHSVYDPFLMYTLCIYSTCIYGPPDDTPAGRGAFFSGSQGGRYNIG